ncbi:MAG: PH domain-containing protein [Candidatus Campbellbacteria bacterium]|nr:PH domain-containing protein [Candidatus Campbellbacteria bacterium]
MIDLHEGEKIDMVIRKHWFVLVSRIFSLFLLLFLPLVVYYLINFLMGAWGTENQLSMFDSIDGAYLLLGLILWFFFIWIWAFIIWTDYYLDVWIITNERILDIEQHGFFRREISTFRAERIQDVTIEVHGVISTFLNFGTIHVQTAGENRYFEMKGAPAPTHLKQVINSLQRNSSRNSYRNEGGA